MIGNSKKQKNQNLKKKVLDLEGPSKERSMFGKVYRLNPWTLFSVPFEGPGIYIYILRKFLLHVNPYMICMYMCM